MTHQRDRIHDHIVDHPGLHFNELTRQLDLAPGQTQYHIKKLIRGEQIVAEQYYGQTHYYPPGFEQWERGSLALFRRETARDILLYLLEHGPTAPATVASKLDLARSTVEWHVDRLSEQDLVEKHRDWHNRVTLVPSRPDDTAILLKEISPALPDRLVDRFMRFVDTLLSE
ncbi:winged helix-turn-helix transcriptional regulator [Halocatena halophila]|uniref:winged helix-turn-helix transcriptional regulator n=1 Tax=Halocatena halophila TaxID=2814576 RepID=UPI002ED1D76B